MKHFITIPCIAGAMALGGCATSPPVRHASLGSFTPPSIKEAPHERAAPAPEARQKDECAQATPAARLVCKCVIGPRCRP
jgi:hypothetical protein